MIKKYFRTLTIAGSDSGGGAGIQADLKTFSAFGCYGMSAVTALTAQNTVGVQAIHVVPPNIVHAQIQSVLEDIGVDAVKIGMLANSEIINIVATQLKKYNLKNIVLDPVMIAKDGSSLLQTDAINELKKLFTDITLITPNLIEAEFLSGDAITNKKEMASAAQKICAQGVAAVLIKGGHLANTEYCNDCLYVKSTKEIFWFSSPRIVTHNTHGTGCTLSAAITALLAKGFDLLTAVQQAKDYLYCAIREGAEYSLGNGQGPVKHQCDYSH